MPRSLPYFSVVLPTYNRVQFIEEAIKSVLYQSFDDWELFVVNDGSQDGTDKKIEKYSSNQKVHIINMTTNSGVSEARNQALHLANGKYIAFLDDDDLYEPSFLEVMYKQIKLNKDDYDFYWSGIGLFNEDNKEKREIVSKTIWSVDSKTNEDKEILLRKIALAHGMVIKASSLKKVGYFDKNFINSEDKDLFLRMIEHNYSYQSIPKVLVLKRNHEFSKLSHNSDKSIRVKSAEMIIEKHFKYLQKNPKLLRMLKRSLARKYYRASRNKEGRMIMKELFRESLDIQVLLKWIKLEMKY